MPIIQACELVHEYAPGRGVSGVSLDVEVGECFAILGRNGSGKTTLTRLILGLERPSSGTLTVLGCRLDSGERQHLERIGVALDVSIHWEHLSGGENTYFILRSYGMPCGQIDRRLDEFFSLADLGDRIDDEVKTYSFGMRRKLSIIQAFCHDPELFVLDEPTTGLDPQFLLRLTDIVKTRTKEGQTTWIAGNDPDWIGSVATRVGVMISGQILNVGKVEDFVNEVSPLQKIQVNISQQAHIPPLEKAAIRSFNQTGKTITAILENDPMLVPMIMEWIVSQGGEINTVEVSRGTLRDAFLLKTGRTLEE